MNRYQVNSVFLLLTVVDLIVGGGLPLKTRGYWTKTRFAANADNGQWVRNPIDVDHGIGEEECTDDA
jgi:hypothetical protein